MKVAIRSLVLVFLACLGHAAPRAAKTPAQMPLPFPAASAIPGASSNNRHALPAPPKAPPQAKAQLESMAAMPPKVAEAVRSGDAVAFYKASLAAGYVPAATDDALQRLYYEGAGRIAADTSYLVRDSRRPVARKPAAPRKPAARKPTVKPAVKSASAPKKPVRATKINYAEFGRLSALSPQLSSSVYEDIEPKRRILALAGYTHLIGPKGIRIPIGLADGHRLGKAYANTLRSYKSYLRRISR